MVGNSIAWKRTHCSFWKGGLGFALRRKYQGIKLPVWFSPPTALGLELKALCVLTLCWAGGVWRGACTSHIVSVGSWTYRKVSDLLVLHISCPNSIPTSAHLLGARFRWRTSSLAWRFAMETRSGNGIELLNFLSNPLSQDQVTRKTCTQSIPATWVRQ